MRKYNKKLILSVAVLMLFSTVTQSFATENDSAIVNDTPISESILDVNNNILDEKVVDESTIDGEMLPTADNCSNFSVYKAGTPFCDSPGCGFPLFKDPTNYQILYKRRTCIDGSGNVYSQGTEEKIKIGCC